MARLPRPMAQIGPHKHSWIPYQKRERLAVMTRCRAICEGCGKTTPYMEGAHIFGRRQIVGEPWASSRFLVMGLCRIDLFTDTLGCHEKIDRYLDPELRAMLEDVAAKRLYVAFQRPYPESLEPAGALRQLVTAVESDPDREELMRQVFRI